MTKYIYKNKTYTDWTELMDDISDDAEAELVEFMNNGYRSVMIEGRIFKPADIYKEMARGLYDMKLAAFVNGYYERNVKEV